MRYLDRLLLYIVVMIMKRFYPVIVIPKTHYVHVMVFAISEEHIDQFCHERIKTRPQV